MSLARMRQALAVAALLLGAAHIAYGIMVFRTLSPDFIWFAGAGVAILLAAVVNLDGQASPLIVRIGNTAMTIYLGAMASVLPLPQVWLGLALFVALTVVSAIGPDRSPRRPS